MTAVWGWVALEGGMLFDDFECPCGRQAYVRRSLPNGYLAPIRCNGCGEDIEGCLCPSAEVHA